MTKGSAIKTNPVLWNTIVSKVKSGSKGGDAGEWSARKAQLAVQMYKRAGGGYLGRKSSANPLVRWTNQKWRTSDRTPSRGKKRYLPDAAWNALTPSERAATNKAKALGDRSGKQFVPQPKSIARKTAKFRR